MALQLERLNTESESQDGGDGDTSLKDFQQSTIRYANLKLGPGSEKDPEPPTSKEKSVSIKDYLGVVDLKAFFLVKKWRK